MYSEEQISQADSILAYMLEHRGEYVDSTDLYIATGGGNNYMRRVMIEDLNLLIQRGALIRLTDEGIRAAEVGLVRYLKEKENIRQQKEWAVWISIVSGTVGVIGGILGIISFLSTCQR